MKKKHQVTYAGQPIEYEKYTEPFHVDFSSQTIGLDTWRPDTFGKFKAKINTSNGLVIVQYLERGNEELTFEEFYNRNENKVKKYFKSTFLSSIGRDCIKKEEL